MMLRTLIIIAALSMALGLGGCNGSEPLPDENLTLLNWTRLGDFAWQGRRGAIAAEAGDLIYMGYGVNQNNVLLNDFWIYDPLKNSWLQTNGQEVVKRELVLLSIDDRIFLISDQQLSTFDMYEYVIAESKWEPRSTFTKESNTSYITAGFSFSGKGYYVPANGGKIHEYDPQTDSWTEKSTIPGPTARNTDLFLLSGKAYLYGTSGNLTDNFYVYDIADDTWETIVNENGPTVESGFTSLSVNNRGYVIMGGSVTTDAMGNPLSNSITPQIWEYDPVENSWIRKTDFPGANRTDSFSFTYQNQGYLGSGYNSQLTYLKDLWTFSVTP